jgi:type IV pilus assembly protein PilE
MQQKKLEILGISLVEIMVVMAIMAIVALAAFPSYQQHLQATRRQEALLAIRNMQLAVDQYITEHAGNLPEASAFPPVTTDNQLYTVTYAKEDTNTYKIQAQAQPGSAQENDKVTDNNGNLVNCNIIYITNILDTTYPHVCK